MFKLTVSFDGQSIDIGYRDDKPERNKGNSLLEFPYEYTVIDIETTGLDPEYDEIIEIGGLKVSNGEIIDEFCSLVKPSCKIPEFIENLTGITNQMVKEAPSIKKVLPRFIDFIGDSILVAYNAHFDINFIYDNYLTMSGIQFRNDFIDVLRISRRAYPELSNHKLGTLAEYLDVTNIPKHRSIADCYVCNEVLIKSKNYVLENKINLKVHPYKLDVKSILPQTAEFNPDHPLFNKVCVFTGTLNKFLRKEAMQIVVNLGGSCKDNITKDTNYLVMGVQDYSKFTDGQKSNKTKKAEDLIAAGFELSIITENAFYDMILDYMKTNHLEGNTICG